MAKYRITFKTEVMVDGFTDFRDREYETIRRTVSVDAKNMKQAQRLAVKKAGSYYVRGVYPHSNNWGQYNITKVTRLNASKTTRL